MYLNHFSLEDFSKPSPQFIISRKDTNILNAICADLTPKIDITRFIVSAVKKRDRTYFITHAHVKWAMECIGFAFALPIDQSTIISQAVEIYRNWLDIGSEERPSCIEETEGFYQREIISHLSLLFLERGGDMHRHAELCRDVLLLVKDLSRQKSLEDSTWEHLLKIFLIITANLIKNNTQLIKEIAPLLFKTLFELWFRSNTREPTLWEELTRYMSHWLNNIWVVHHWTALEIGLTRSLINIIYNSDRPILRKKSTGISITDPDPYTMLVKISFKPLPKPFEMDMESLTINATYEKIIYFWYRLLQMITLTTINRMVTDAEICTELVRSFAALVQEFLKFTFERRSKSKPGVSFVDGTEESGVNELIRKLAEVHMKYVEGEGRVVCPRINSILGVFGNWLFAYANYDHLHCEKGRAKALAVLCRIFSSNLGPVSEDLAGKFYKTLSNSLKTGVSQIIIKNILKYSTALLSCDLPGIRMLIDKEYLLKAVTLQLNDEKSQSVLKKYCYNIISCFSACVNYLQKEETIKTLQDILLNAVQKENNAENLNQVVWIVSGFIATGYLNTEGINNLVISMTNRLKIVNENKMYLDLVGVISTLPFLISQNTLIAKTAQKVVKKVISYLRKKLQKPQGQIITALLFALLKWLACFPDIIVDSHIRESILEILTCARLLSECSELAQYIEEYMTCRIGKLPHKISLNQLNSIEVPLGSITKPISFEKSYLVYNSTLINFSGSGDQTLIVMRNRIGRSIWTCRIVLTDSPLHNQLVLPIENLNISKQIIEARYIETDFHLNESESEANNKLSRLMKLQKSHPKKISAFDHYSYNFTSETIENDPMRLLISHLGLVDYDQLMNITEIQPETSSHFIKNLDGFCEKEIFFMPILYLNSSNSTDFLSNSDSYSSQFQCFLKQIGVKLDSRHLDLGFLSHISMHISKYKALLYFSDSVHEVLSIVPAANECELSLQEVVEASPVVVLWNEQQDDDFSIFLPSILQYPELEHKVCILLTPIKKKFIKVNFFPNKDIPGPLIDTMILPTEYIGMMLTYTLINTYGNSLEAITTRKNRQDLLEQLEIIGKSEESTPTRLNSLLSYEFNII